MRSTTIRQCSRLRDSKAARQVERPWTNHPTHWLPNELALAVECCATIAHDRTAKASRLAQNVDWTRFLAVCRRHRIQGVVWRAIKSFELNPPDQVAAHLASDAVKIATDGLRSAGISSQMFCAFMAADIPILFVKGLTLSKLAYGDPFVKMSHDIDVLVPVEKVDRAGATLSHMGYARARLRNGDLATWHRVHKESVWTRFGYPTIELHSRLADNPRLIPGIGNHSPVQQVEVAPGLTLPTLAPDELIAYLCVHGASSAWFRLKWIADLAALLTGTDLAGIDRLLCRGQQLGAGRSVPAALLLSNRLFEIALGPAAELEVCTFSNRLLARTAMQELIDEIEPTQQLLGTLAIHLSQFLLLPGLPFMGSELARQIKSSLSRN